MSVISQVPVTKYMVASEMSQVEHWVIEKFKHEDQYHLDLPFSFSYGEQSSHQLLKNWDLQRHTEQLDEHRTEHKLTYTDTVTGLILNCLMVEYHHFPVVEWTLSFRNSGSEDTPIITDIQALDTQFVRQSGDEYILNHHTGSPCTPTDYQPHQTTLEPKASKKISTSGGRPSNSDLPFFNLQWPEGGIIIAIGWPGQWSIRFDCNEESELRVQAGQERTHFLLHPGEEVRSPLIAVQFWETDRLRAHNTWRHWMLTQNLPRPYDQPVAPQTAACSSHQYEEMIKANEENQKMFIDGYLREGLQLDYWWMDAGWYPNKSGWTNTGTWEVDTTRFPNQLRAITDYGRSKDVKSIVWFEAERVTPDTWLYDNHPEWLLGETEWKLLNLGDSDARNWLIEHIDNLINEQGIDLYRVDFNIDPLVFWRGNDSEDRQGITEIKYVMGFLTYWDELRRRHPDMLIDTCASGGRRNDLETLRRAVPLLRSDLILEPTAQQNHTYGIAFWIPFYGTGINAFDAYTFRSQMCVHSTACYDMRNPEQDFETLRQRYAEWHCVSPYSLGDYYPLTPYNSTNDVWMAWQFDRTDLGEGVIQVFRRPNSLYESARFNLRGLIAEATYTLNNFDQPGEIEMTSCELMESGLLVSITEQPGSAIITYKLEN